MTFSNLVYCCFAFIWWMLLYRSIFFYIFAFVESTKDNFHIELGKFSMNFISFVFSDERQLVLVKKVYLFFSYRIKFYGECNLKFLQSFPGLKSIIALYNPILISNMESNPLNITKITTAISTISRKVYSIQKSFSDLSFVFCFYLNIFSFVEFKKIRATLQEESAIASQFKLFWNRIYSIHICKIVLKIYMHTQQFECKLDSKLQMVLRFENLLRNERQLAAGAFAVISHIT